MGRWGTAHKRPLHTECTLEGPHQQSFQNGQNGSLSSCYICVHGSTCAVTVVSTLIVHPLSSRGLSYDFLKRPRSGLRLQTQSAFCSDLHSSRLAAACWHGATSRCRHPHRISCPHPKLPGSSELNSDVAAFYLENNLT